MSNESTQRDGHGPIGIARSGGLTVLVTVVTLGIWGLVWSFKNGDEIKAYRGDGIGGVLFLILSLLFWPATMFLMGDEVEKMYQAAGEVSPINALWGLWFLLPLIGPLIWYFRIQGALNDFWTARGADQPTGL